MTRTSTAPPRSAYAGLCLTALATLMFEILLTRIFSATTWYHFAFLAISVAMFGMTAGAIAVYLRPKFFTDDRVTEHLTLFSFLFAIAIPISFLSLLCIPFSEDTTSMVGLFSFALTYSVIAVPFFFSGVAVCLALTKYPTRVSALYAADLLGAAAGCILLIWLLGWTDGPTAVFAVAAVASLGSISFGFGGARPKWLVAPVLLGLACAVFAVKHTGLAEAGTPWLYVKHVKGRVETRPEYERWNSFSRITVSWHENKKETPTAPVGWSLSAVCDHKEPILQRGLLIDGLAGTVITRFDGDTSKLAYLKCDGTNLAHNLRSDADVLAIGMGGGRDVLSALVFDQRSVTGVEMNDEIIRAVTEEYGEFAGHLDQHPKVRLVHDEARSFVARSEDRFDIIQISLIDTWAATSAGAFVLAENSLYTVEAWRIFLDHLTERGMLTVSRFYRLHSPGETYRMTALAAAVLRERGVEHPERHMALIRTGGAGLGVGTLLVSREPLTEDDYLAVERESQEHDFQLMLGRGESPDPVLAAIARGEEPDGGPLIAALDLSPPTDDRPFFFNMIRLGDLFQATFDHWTAGENAQPPIVLAVAGLEANRRAVFILAVLLVVVVVLTSICIFLPLLLTADRSVLRGRGPLLTYFATIGFGFMLVELSQMHRLIIFLGHPIYGLSVVLFALLLSSGLGSFLSQGVSDPRRGGARTLLALLALLVVFGLMTPALVETFQSSTTPVRIGVAVALLFPIGILMGTAFPLGMRLASDRAAELTPWMWGINGATSVCASVLATAISLSFSISTAFWVGTACYVLAWMTFTLAGRRAAAELT